MTMDCTCEVPQRYTRPSGEVICINCGLTIPAPPPPKVERP
jgi:hypothetical protein